MEGPYSVKCNVDDGDVRECRTVCVWVWWLNMRLSGCQRAYMTQTGTLFGDARAAAGSFKP